LSLKPFPQLNQLLSPSELRRVGQTENRFAGRRDKLLFHNAAYAILPTAMAIIIVAISQQRLDTWLQQAD
jgi:hypothetical protein